MQVVFAMISVFLIFLQCKPTRALWDHTIQGDCWPQSIFYDFSYWVSAYTTMTDIVLAVVPISVFWKLQMRKSTKLAVCVMMGLTLLSAIVTIVKATYLPLFTDVEDPLDCQLSTQDGRADRRSRLRPWSGIQITSANHGQHTFRLDRVIRTPSEASDTKFAFVLCTHKAVDPDAAIVPLDPVITEDTTIVVLQNGVGNEDPFRKRYPNQTVISGVVWVGAAQPSPGIITHTTAERTQLGLFPNPSIPSAIEESRLNAFAALLSSGGTHFDICANIQISRWEKVVWNVAWNAITTLTDQDVESWLNSSPNAVRYTRRLMGEVVAVARASGVLLDEGLIDTLMDRVKGLGKLRTSMQADREAGRGMEVEVILGVPVKRGREYGVATPFLESLYVLLTALNRKILEGAR
ncbi:ketopantoate reductase PanE/ApbA C terminal-domain-containing protein [Aspergillus granulosus]|uniref:Ketopantoate reductase PanE/ApbA C terminal-domain-containing protein n=1 Tax=Aspergillus granulosus TaxID=176169 RepID=A0ABR4GUU9_9EURO